MVFMTKDKKFIHFEKSRKNTFLVNAKKWKKWEKWTKKKTKEKWHKQNAIISSMLGRMRKIVKIKRVFTEDETFF